MTLEPISRTDLVEVLRHAADQLIDLPAYWAVDWGHIEWRNSPDGSIWARYAYGGGHEGHNEILDLAKGIFSQ